MKRLDRIAQAQAARPVLPPPTAEDYNCARVFARLLATMEPAYRVKLRRDVEAGATTPLLRFATIVIDRHLRLEAPLELPAIVIALVERNLDSRMHECSMCGYALPRVFTACPLCRGAVGWQAWSIGQA